MQVGGKSQDRVFLLLAIAAAAAIHVSIALSQTLMGIAVLLFLLRRGKLFFPRIWIPLAAFFLWTALADVLSPDPWGGRAQIRKFFVFFFIPLLYGVFRERIESARMLLAAWAMAAGASGLFGLYQFIAKYHHAKQTGEDFYVTYVGHRITGFESHWMTFGALQLSVFALLLAYLFFAGADRVQRSKVGACATAGILFIAIVLGETRGIWLATIAAAIYLLYAWKPKLLLALPVVLAVTFLVAPNTTKERIESVVAPHGETDSNRHRYVMFRTGLEMVKAHPWFGLGPEQIRRQFDSYVPPDIARPLPTGYYGHLHSIYLQYAAERGIPGAALLGWLIVMTLTDCVKAIRKLRGERSTELFVLHGAVAVIIGVLVGGIFEHNLGDSEVLMMFTSVVGLGYAAVFTVNSRPAQTAFPLAPEGSGNAENPALGQPLPSLQR